MDTIPGHEFCREVKLVLGFQINRDPQMVDPRKKIDCADI